MRNTRSRRKLITDEEKVLPTEVIYEIVRHLDFEDLVKLRLINRSWNEATCRLLKTHYKLKMIRITNRQNFLTILSMKQNGIQPFFFTKFDLVLSGLNISSTIQLGTDFGPYIRELSLDTRRKQSTDKRMAAKLWELLSRTPCLQVLKIMGNNNGTSFMENITPVELNRLKTLELTSPFDSVLSVIDHSAIVGWVEKAPALTKLIVTPTLNPATNHDLPKFFVQIKNIQHLSLCLRFKPQNQNMFKDLTDAKVQIRELNMVVEMDDAEDHHNLLFLNMYSWLATQGPYLKRFVHQLHTQIIDGPILEKLRLFGEPLLTSGRSVQPFRVGQSSSLYFVSVLSTNASEIEKIYQPLAAKGLFEHMEASITSINKKTTNILRYLFPNLYSINSSHYFVA